MASCRLVKIDGRGLDERGDGHRLLGAQGNVAGADFDRVEEGMRPDIPPDFLGVVDAVGAHQQADVVLKLGIT